MLDGRMWSVCNVGPQVCSVEQTEGAAVTHHIRSTQPCIPPGSLNRVPALAGLRAGMSPLPGGR